MPIKELFVSKRYHLVVQLVVVLATLQEQEVLVAAMPVAVI